MKEGFYAPEVRKQLEEMLRANSPEADPRQVPDPDVVPVSPRRLVYDLDRVAKDLVASFYSLRGGRLDKRLAIARRAEGLDRVAAALENFLTETAPEIDEYERDLLNLLQRLRAGLSIYRAPYVGSPGGIKSEGKNSSNLARELVQEFRVVASRVWYEGTGQPSTPNKSPEGLPIGDYSKFIDAAVNPIVQKINQHRRGVITDKWRTHYDGLYRRAKVHRSGLLGADRERRTRKRQPMSNLPK